MPSRATDECDEQYHDSRGTPMLVDLPFSGALMTGIRRTTLALFLAASAVRADQPRVAGNHPSVRPRHAAPDSALAAVVAAARAGTHGLVNRMLVIRDGK